MSNHAKKLFVFAGSYAEPAESGLYVYEFNEDTLELKLLDEASDLKNPTFLNVDFESGFVYAISEGVAADGSKNGEAVSFRFDKATGTLERINEQTTVASSTCHIQRDPKNKYLITVSYHGGYVGLSKLEENGVIGALLDQQQHTGHSVDAERQDRPHPHSSFFSPDGQYLFVQDLGLDIIRTYRIDREADKLVAVHDNVIHPGAGPRHLVFHPNGKHAFVINEVDSTITTLLYDAATGQLTDLGSVSTLPEGYEGENTTAEITVSEDGRYLYGSNRGHDSIVVFAINSDNGSLLLVEHVYSEGGHPRHFALTPGGQFLLAANRDANNIAVFRVNKENGTLQFTGHSAQLSKPVCVLPVYVSVS